MVFGKSATATLSSDAGYINSGTPSTKSRFSQSLIVGYAAGGFDAVYRINQDVGSVYADRKSNNFGGMGGSQSQSGIGMNGGALSWDTFGVHYIFAVSGREKIVMSTVNSGDAGSYNWSFQNAWKYVPSDLSDTFDNIQLQDGFGTNPSGTDVEENSTAVIFGAEEVDGGSPMNTDSLLTNSIFEESDTGKHYIWNSSTSTWTEVA